MKKSGPGAYILSLLILFFFLSNCSSKVKPFHWLNGTWEMRRSAGGTRLEIWTPHTGESIAGKGLLINAADTTVLEQIQLVFRDNNFYYIATVPDQNNGLPIEFKLIKTEGNIYTFENPLHDFPQRIIYHFKPIAEQIDNDLPADSLLVRVEGFDGNGIAYGFARRSLKKKD